MHLALTVHTVGIFAGRVRSGCNIETEYIRLSDSFVFGNLCENELMHWF